jgi:hypothetical protein
MKKFILAALLMAACLCQSQTNVRGNNGVFNGSVTAQSVDGQYNSAKFATISSAITSATGAGQQSVGAPCGPINDNLLITAGPVDVFGLSNAQNCSILQPLVPGTDLFKIDATASGTTSGTAWRNFDVNCPAGTCGNIATITASQTTNQPNDWLNVQHIFSSQFGINTTGTAGFANGIVITAGTIFSKFENLRIDATRGDGLKVALSGGLVRPFNANTINNSLFQGNFGYGLNIDCTGAVTLCEANAVTNTDIESNAQNTALSPCAGALIKGVYLFNFFHSAFEGNCPSSADPNSAQIRITGTTSVPYFVNTIGSDFNMTIGAAKYGLYADATRSGGVFMGNRSTAPPTAGIHIAAQSTDSLWEIGVNRGFGKWDIVQDANLNTHVTAPASGVVGDYMLIGPGTGCPTTGGTFDLVNGCGQDHQLNNIGLNGATATWSNWINSIPGSWILAQAFTSNGYTLTNSAGGAGQFISRDGNNIVLATTGDAVLFRTDGNGNLQEMFRSNVSLPNTWLKDQAFSGNITQSGAKKISTGSAGLSINSGTALTGQNGTAANTNAVTSPTSSPYVGVASDFTTPADTNFHAITGLSWVFPAIAGSYNFHCAILYQQNVATASVFLGIQAVTNNPINIAAVGHMSTNANGSAADNTLPTLATTTATNIVNGGPSATGTVFLAFLDGRIELGASANTINIMTGQSVAADTVTIKRGSSCQLY